MFMTELTRPASHRHKALGDLKNASGGCILGLDRLDGALMAAANVLLEIPKNILTTARLSLEGLKIEIAIHLYAERRLSFGKACELAGLSIWQFRQILAARQIPANLDPEDLDEEMSNLAALKLL
jgi:predicted HTH domain antitoxin